MSEVQPLIYNQLKYAFGLSAEEGNTNSIESADGHLFNNNLAQIPIRLGFRVEADSDDPLIVTIEGYGITQSKLMTDLSVSSFPDNIGDNSFTEFSDLSTRKWEAYPRQSANPKDFSSWGTEPLNLTHQWRYFLTNKTSLNVDESAAQTFMGWVHLKVTAKAPDNTCPASTEFILYSNMDASWDVLGTTMFFQSSIVHQVVMHGKPPINIVHQRGSNINTDSAFDTLEVWELVGHYESEHVHYIDGRDPSRCNFGKEVNMTGYTALHLSPEGFWEASFWGTRGGVNEITRVILHQNTGIDGSVINSSDYLHKVSGTISQHLHNTSVSYDYRASTIDTNGNTATALTYSWFFMKDSRIENDLAGDIEFGYNDLIVVADVFGGSTQARLKVTAERHDLSTHSVTEQLVLHV